MKAPRTFLLIHIFNLTRFLLYDFLSVHLFNSEKKIISLTGHVSYVDSKDNIHLCLKANTTQRKYHGNCLPEGRVVRKITWVSGKLDNHGRFSIRDENEGAKRSVTKRHDSLGSSLVPDHPEFKGRERLEQCKTHKQN